MSPPPKCPFPVGDRDPTLTAMMSGLWVRGGSCRRWTATTRDSKMYAWLHFTVFILGGITRKSLFVRNNVFVFFLYSNGVGLYRSPHSTNHASLSRWPPLPTASQSSVNRGIRGCAIRCNVAPHNPVGIWTPSNIMVFLGPRESAPSQLAIGSSVFAQRNSAHHTDHAMMWHL